LNGFSSCNSINPANMRSALEISLLLIAQYYFQSSKN